MAPIASRLFCPILKMRRRWYGAIAQLGERIVRNDEVGGSIPPGSTNPHRLRPLRPGKPFRSDAEHLLAQTWADALERYSLRRRLHAEAPAIIPSFSRKSRRPLLDEARDAFAEVGAAQRDDHFAVGLDRCLRQSLEWHIVKLPLDHGHGARRHEISKVARVGVG